ncbi:MAG: AAA family ATPase [Campylobacterota bacterium]|nr:AAA family ATPase [Campylobacterota bacterium]
MNLKKLPIGIQTFSEIINKNYLYIDKTNIAYNLITKESKYIFLSRPRRFGKSLFLDTLHNIFEGNRELFKGLGIYDKWDWKTKYPVIKISFSGDLRSGDALKTNILSILKSNQKRLGIECEDTNSVGMCLKELIELAYEKHNQQVVVLIDEYDKAILDNLDQMEVAQENREIIKGLYSVLKESDPFLKFVFLTGVSKFSKASIFSGLNMMEDISLNRHYGNICGYTQNDVQTSFLPYLTDVDLEKVKVWYNGYNFLKDDVYNPFDLLLFIKNEYIFDNYWFSTGTPTFLIKLIEKNNYFLPKLSNLTVDKKLLDSFDIDNLDLEVILYQAGYLTIDEMIQTRRGRIEYKLKLPNEEVRASFSDIVIDGLTKQKTEKLRFQDNIYDALIDNDLDLLKSSLKSMFASIPYNNYTKNDIQHFEGFYASIIYVYLQSLGLEIIGEDVTNKGRIDLTVFIENSIYIIEFKVGDTDALEQIKAKDYASKYLNENNDIYLVGINFDEKEKNISSFKWEILKSKT